MSLAQRVQMLGRTGLHAQSLVSVSRPSMNAFRMHGVRSLSTQSTTAGVDASLNLDPLTAQMGDFAKERERSIRSAHESKRLDFPERAQPANPSDKVDPELANRKRLIYRSKQRGWLEVDLLLGSWAMDNVMSLNDEQLVEYERILNMETLDIFNLITGTHERTADNKEIPAEVKGEILNRLQAYALTSPAGEADPESYAKLKTKMSN